MKGEVGCVFAFILFAVFQVGHLPRDAAKGMLNEESTAAEMRGEGKKFSRLIPATNSEG